ncbi:MAG: ABC transporter ATP-binding protein [Planctomycetota bacterium]|jgi:ABC-2 type transport system ATP-binding protein
MQYAVETFSLTKIFTDWWGRNKVCAVDHLDLKVFENEVFGLLGPNGSGKTTTLKMLLGLLRPSKGKTLCLGGDSTDPKINGRIGFMPEESYLYKYLNARETLDFYGRLFGLPVKVRKIRIESLLDMVGLKAVANRPVGTFSKGMARRIGLAQALINDPDLLILDEPTTGLDPIGTRQIKDLIIQLAKRGKTVLLCSHLLADVEDVCDRIAILYGGRIQTEGQVHMLLQQTDKTQITANRLSSSTTEKIKQLIESEKCEYVITSPMDKLETFFIKTVTEAQKAKQPTSGVVSTTQIGDFLSSEKTENILDKLVSAETSPKIRKPPKTKPVKPSKKIKPDEGLLKDLTKQKTAPQTKTVTKPQAEQMLPAKDDSIKKDILNQLTKDSQRSEDNNQTEKDTSAGDSSDA